MSIQTYQKTLERAEAPRETEYRALALATNKLIEAKDIVGKERIDACYTNLRLWNIFQADLVHPGNGLPNDLKGQLISLSIWVQKYSGKAMRGDASLDPLIDVNKSIMEGLKPVESPPVGVVQESKAVNIIGSRI